MKFGFSFGFAQSESCPSPAGELIKNHTFDCGEAYWTEANSTATFTGSKVRVVRNGPGAMVWQNITLESGVEYYIDVSVTATDSTGFVNIVDPDNTSTYPLDYLDVGNHTLLFTPTISGTYKIGIGTNNPVGSYAEFDWLSVHKMAVTESPCMTSSTSPYGIVSGSSYFSSSYMPVEGMNCAVSSANAWISKVRAVADVPDDGVARGDYLDWRLTQDDLDDGMPEMVPTRFEIRPRGGMTAAWYHDRNPKAISVFGVKLDNTFDELFSLELADWGNGAARSWDITTSNKYKGFRVYVTKVNWEASNGQYNTGWSNMKMYGKYPS